VRDSAVAREAMGWNAGKIIHPVTTFLVGGKTASVRDARPKVAGTR